MGGLPVALTSRPALVAPRDRAALQTPAAPPVRVRCRRRQLDADRRCGDLGSHGRARRRGGIPGRAATGEMDRQGDLLRRLAAEAGIYGFAYLLAVQAVGVVADASGFVMQPVFGRLR